MDTENAYQIAAYQLAQNAASNDASPRAHPRCVDLFNLLRIEPASVVAIAGALNTSIDQVNKHLIDLAWFLMAYSNLRLYRSKAGIDERRAYVYAIRLLATSY